MISGQGRVDHARLSVIGPLLYLIYTADASTRDDTATLSADADPARASEEPQHHLNLL
jgi:hypothetical protein